MQVAVMQEQFYLGDPGYSSVHMAEMLSSPSLFPSAAAILKEKIDTTLIKRGKCVSPNEGFTMVSLVGSSSKAFKTIISLFHHLGTLTLMLHNICLL